MVWIVTWHEDVVEVVDGRYGPRRTWIEPLAAFDGLERVTGQQQRGNAYTPNHIYHGLQLRHPDPQKSILLHAQRRPLSADTIAAYAAALNLPPPEP